MKNCRQLNIAIFPVIYWVSSFIQYEERGWGNGMEGEDRYLASYKVLFTRVHDNIHIISVFVAIFI